MVLASGITVYHSVVDIKMCKKAVKNEQFQIPPYITIEFCLVLWFIFMQTNSINHIYFYIFGISY